MGATSPDPAERDAEQVRRSLAGDRAAYDALVVRYREIVYALAFQVLDDVHAAEDVSQNALLVAYRRLGTLKEPRRFAPWLRRVVLRECSAWARRLYSRSAAEERAERASIDFDPLLAADGLADRRRGRWVARIEDAVKTLSRDHCEVLALFYVRGLTHEEISNFLGVPKGTVKRRLFDARKSLQGEVEGEPLSSARRETARLCLEAFHKALEARLEGGEAPQPGSAAACRRGEDVAGREARRE